MPYNTACDHPNCYGRGCKMLTPEELEPTEEDHEFAQRLMVEKYIQTSSKYRTVRRWKEPPPTVEQMVRPEYLGTFFANQLAERLHFLTDDLALRCAPREMVEGRELTVRQFRAYKALGGTCWWPKGSGGRAG